MDNGGNPSKNIFRILPVPTFQADYWALAALSLSRAQSTTLKACDHFLTVVKNFLFFAQQEGFVYLFPRIPPVPTVQVTVGTKPLFLRPGPNQAR